VKSKKEGIPFPIEKLDDELLGAISDQLDQWALHSFPFVNKQFRRVFKKHTTLKIIVWSKNEQIGGCGPYYGSGRKEELYPISPSFINWYFETGGVVGFRIVTNLIENACGKEIIDWLNKKCSGIFKNGQLLCNALFHNRMDVIILCLRQIGEEAHEDEEIYYDLVTNGTLDMCKFLYNELLPTKYMWTNTECMASGVDNVEMLIWLEDLGCEFKDGEVFFSAATSGSINNLKWLVEKGCRWDDLSLYFAKSSGYDDVVRYLRENKPPELVWQTPHSGPWAECDE
jgi:hypothetical protein